MEASEPPFTVENIERTLHHLYNDVRSQLQANQFLMSAQSSSEAWNFAWELLHPTKPSEVQFFGANTLYMKISRCWHELSADHYMLLRDRLFSVLFMYVSGPKIIRTRVCVTMSSFVLQTITDFWPTAITDIIIAVQSQNSLNLSPDQVAYVILELLTILSEESQTMHQTNARMGLIRSSLRSSLDMIMSLVESVLGQTSSSPELCNISLKCYSSWSLLGSDVLEKKSLILLIFDSVYRDEISSTALETLMNIVNHPESEKYPNLILEMIEYLTKFDCLLEKSSQEYDADKCELIYGLIIATAENHIQLLLKTILEKPEKKDNILKLVNFILKCSSTPGQYPTEEIVSEQAFIFWYNLQDAINISQKGRESLILVFQSVYHLLVDTYLIKLRYPPDDIYKHWKQDEKEALRCYRQDIGDSIMYCYSVLKTSLLANLMSHFELALTTAKNSPIDWQYLEAVMYAFRSIAECIDVQESNYIPMFLNLLKSIPLEHIRIISGTMEAIGAYAEYINADSSVLGCVIPLVLTGLQHADVAISATFALKDITADCHSSIQPFAEQILSTCLNAISGNVLKSREKVRTMVAVGRVLSAMPYSFIMKYLDMLLLPIFNQLQEQLSSEKKDSSNSVIIVHNLNLLAMLFKTLDIHYDKELKDEEDSEISIRTRNENLNMPQPIHGVLGKLLHLFTAEENSWDVNEQTTEALCDTMKQALSLLTDTCKVFLPKMLNLLLFISKTCPHPCILDVTKQLVILFVDSPEETPILSEFFSIICDCTIQFTMHDFHESTRVIEAFLEVLEQVIRRAVVFIKADGINLPLLFQCGVAALTLPEKPTAKAACGFLAQFIMHSREHTDMLNVVNGQGEMLLNQVLKNIGGDCPRANVEYLPDVLIALNKKFFDNLCRWLVPFTQQEGFPSARVTQKQKEEFMRLLLRERSNKRKLKETVTEFSLLCRGIIGTEYAAQSCQSLS